MISRRDALKLGAAGLAVPFLGSLQNVIEDNSAHAAQELQGTIETFGGNVARTGESPGPGPRLDLPIVRKWRVGGSDLYQKSWQMPTIVNGVAFVGDGALRAINSDSGDILWSFNPGTDLYAPTYSNHNIYISGANKYLYAVDSATGEELWRYELPGKANSAPAVHDGAVYCGGIDYSTRNGEGCLYSIDAKTGKELWHLRTGYSQELRTPAISGGIIYVNDFYRLYAVDTETGNLLWTFETSSDGARTPSISNGTVFLKDNFRLYALDGLTGEEIWRTDSTGYSTCEPSVSNGFVYFGEKEGVVYAYDVSNGMRRWSFYAPGNFNSKPTIAAGVLYINASHSELFAIDAATGSGIWRIRHAGNGAPAIVDGNIYVGTDALVMIGNLRPTVLADDVVLRASPSNSGMERGQATAGAEVSSLGSREERGETLWVEATIGNTTGWIPLDSVEPGTLPPEGEIVTAEFY